MSRLLTNASGSRLLLCPSGRRFALSSDSVCCGDAPPCEGFYRFAPCPDFGDEFGGGIEDTDDPIGDGTGGSGVCGGQVRYFRCNVPLSEPVSFGQLGTATDLDSLFRLFRLANPGGRFTVRWNGNCYRLTPLRVGIFDYFRFVVCQPGEVPPDDAQCMTAAQLQRARVPSLLEYIPNGCGDQRCQPFGKVIIPNACGLGPDARIAVCAQDLDKCIIAPYSQFAPTVALQDANCAVWNPGEGIDPPAGVIVIPRENLPGISDYRTCCECLSENHQALSGCASQSLVRLNQGQNGLEPTGEPCCCPRTYRVLVNSKYERVIPCFQGQSTRTVADNTWVLQYIDNALVSGGVPGVATETVGQGPTCTDNEFTFDFATNFPAATCTGIASSPYLFAPLLPPLSPQVVACSNPGPFTYTRQVELFHACGLFRVRWRTVFQCPDGPNPREPAETTTFEMTSRVIDSVLTDNCKDGCTPPVAVPTDGSPAVPLFPGRLALGAPVGTSLSLASLGCGSCGSGPGL